MEKYARLLAVFQRCGKVHSRIKAQKIFYVLKSLGYPVQENFDYRNYGPYSEQLASEIRSSVNANFLHEEKTESKEEWEDETISYERYDYSIAARGEEFLQAFLERDRKFAAEAKRMADAAAELNRYSPQQLELLATLMFLEDKPVRDELIVPVLQSVKPQFTKEEIETARSAAKRLRDLHSAKSTEVLRG